MCHLGPLARNKSGKTKYPGGDCIRQEVEEHHEEDVIVEEAFLFRQRDILINCQPTTINGMEIPIVNEPAQLCRNTGKVYFCQLKHQTVHTQAER